MVVLAAAKVGGINANNTTPAEFAYENMQIQCNVIKCCHDFHVKSCFSGKHLYLSENGAPAHSGGCASHRASGGNE